MIEERNSFEYYDAIDKDGSFYREQAYLFQQTARDEFKVSVAVYNPLYLLPFPEKNTVSHFLRNLDKLNAIGKKFRRDNPGNFNTGPFSDYALAMRSLYFQKHITAKHKKPFIVFSATAGLDRDGLLKDDIRDFSFDTKPGIRISNHDFSTYGAVYRLYEDEEQDRTNSWVLHDKQETENMRQARGFEESARRHTEMQQKYQHILYKNNDLDSLGRFVVWGSSLVIKSAATDFCQDKPIDLISVNNTSGDEGYHRYESVKNPLVLPPYHPVARLTSPLNEPADLFNLMQVQSYAENGRSMLGSKEVKRLIPELQARYNDQNPCARPKDEIDYNHLPNLKIVGMRPDLVMAGKS